MLAPRMSAAALLRDDALASPVKQSPLSQASTVRQHGSWDSSSEESSSSCSSPAGFVGLLGRERLLQVAQIEQKTALKAQDVASAQRRLPETMLAHTVKNTFIDDLVDGSEAEDNVLLRPLRRCMSCPAIPLGGLPALPDDGDGTPEAEVEIQPLEIREPSASLGSVGHGYGQKSCRPCGWYWRPVGCANGADCRHCHLCDASEVKQRKKKALKAKKVAGRAQRWGEPRR